MTELLVVVQSLNGEELELLLPVNGNVGMIKDKVQEAWHVPSAFQQLLKDDGAFLADSTEILKLLRGAFQILEGVLKGKILFGNT